jgi:predicted nucleic acid-binding protein
VGFLRDQQYYAALGAADRLAEAKPFVEFMLNAIHDALEALPPSDPASDPVSNPVVQLTLTEDEWLNEWLNIPVTTLTKATFFSALERHARHGISHWDSLMVASALEAGCETIYSEDLNHGQDYGGVKVVNPFL